MKQTRLRAWKLSKHPVLAGLVVFWIATSLGAIAWANYGVTHRCCAGADTPIDAVQQLFIAVSSGDETALCKAFPDHGTQLTGALIEEIASLNPHDLQLSYIPDVAAAYFGRVEIRLRGEPILEVFTDVTSVTSKKIIISSVMKPQVEP